MIKEAFEFYALSITFFLFTTTENSYLTVSVMAFLMIWMVLPLTGMINGFNWNIVIAGLAVGGILSFLLFTSIAIVPAGYRGVLLTFGAVTGKPLPEGIHFIIPVVQKVVNMEVRTIKYQADADSASKDLQSVTTTVALNYHLDPSKVCKIYKKLGREYQDRVIIPAIEESVKASTAKFTAEELITKRPKVKEEISNILKERLDDYGIIVETVNIVNFRFSEEFDRAIEEKVTAEQRALTAKRLLEKVKFEAQQKIEAAKGEAEAIRIINDQLEKSPYYLQWLAIQKWDGKLPLVTGNAMPFILLNQTIGEQ